VGPAPPCAGGVLRLTRGERYRCCPLSNVRFAKVAPRSPAAARPRRAAAEFGRGAHPARDVLSSHLQAAPALEHYRAAHLMEPGNLAIRHQMGLSAVTMGDYEAALNDLSRRDLADPDGALGRDDCADAASARPDRIGEGLFRIAGQAKTRPRRGATHVARHGHAACATPARRLRPIDSCTKRSSSTCKIPCRSRPLRSNGTIRWIFTNGRALRTKPIWRGRSAARGASQERRAIPKASCRLRTAQRCSTAPRV
jgi:hypothetical protein